MCLFVCVFRVCTCRSECVCVYVCVCLLVCVCDIADGLTDLDEVALELRAIPLREHRRQLLVRQPCQPLGK